MKTSEAGWKTAREGEKPLNDNGFKRAWRDHRESAEELNEFFALVLTVVDTGERPSWNYLLSGSESEELGQTKVTKSKILELNEKVRSEYGL